MKEERGGRLRGASMPTKEKRVSRCGAKSDTTCYCNDVEIDRYGESRSRFPRLSFALPSLPLHHHCLLFFPFVRNPSLTTRGHIQLHRFSSSRRETRLLALVFSLGRKRFRVEIPSEERKGTCNEISSWKCQEARDEASLRR